MLVSCNEFDTKKINFSIKNKNKILVAPLNWGVGHATRCIPIINALLECGYQPIIASDGNALKLLEKEFPNLKTFKLPSYKIQYPENGNWLKWKLLVNIPTVLRAMKLERKAVKNMIISEDLVGVISDGRLGVRSSKVPSVYITHQLTVLAGIMTFFTTKIHQYYIRKFNECWLPDGNEGISLSGLLGQNGKFIKIRKIGALSRLKKSNLELKWDVLVLLSGIEPLRTQLEKRLISELKYYKGKVLLVKGIFEEHQKMYTSDSITFYNYLLTSELEKIINESKIVVARSGYSTILDLAKLEKKAFFIPTKGQNEQEYLAKYLAVNNIAPFSSQDNFRVEMLKQLDDYTGFNIEIESELPLNLFHFFERK